MEYQLDIHKDKAFYVSQRKDFTLIKGDSFSAMPDFDFKFDMIFADPPYFLSNGGISLQSGKVVCVDKGEWDKGKTPEEMRKWNMQWLGLCREKLKENGSIWISGTYHNIFSVADCLTQLGYRILNVITWQKTNPPVNISCRFFTYSTEFVIWARKSKKVAHKFNYDVMKRLNDGKQMTDVWRLPAIGRWEKSCGKHPTQKPLALLTRIILACTDEGDWVFDPFSGSGTTGIAANLCKRRFCGIEREEEFCRMAMARREEIENLRIKADLKNHIADLRTLDSEPMQDLFACEPISGGRLPFI
ncbi:MAG: DNA-methyltransferase [Prevotella sp.]